MIVEGKQLAEKIKATLHEDILKLGKSASWRIRLAVIQVGENAVTEKFLAQKEKFAKGIGVDVRIYKLPENISTNQLRKKLAEIVHIKENAGVIIQLPLPQQINTQYILDGIIPGKDPDMLSSKSWGFFSTGRSKILPPVVGAIKCILEEANFEIKGKNAVVVGAGRLVGKPVATWLINQAATVSVVDENTLDLKRYTLSADVIISGVGKPGLITSEMVKEGVVVIDAGTSESDGQVVGDVDPSVAKKASIFTPVPGGVGPLTVAILFSNLVELAKK